MSQSLDTFVILKYLEISYLFIVNNLKLYEFNFSLHVELELEVSTLDKFNYHQCQFLTLNSQIGCFYYQGGMEVGRRESIIYSVRIFTVRNGKIVILLMDIITVITSLA